MESTRSNGTDDASVHRKFLASRRGWNKKSASNIPEVRPIFPSAEYCCTSDIASAVALHHPSASTGHKKKSHFSIISKNKCMNMNMNGMPDVVVESCADGPSSSFVRPITHAHSDRS